jgi:D-methionine transport system substrate-binding protein
VSDHDAPQPSPIPSSTTADPPAGLRASLDDSRRKRRRGLLTGLGVVVAAALVGGGFWAGSATAGAGDGAQAATGGGAGGSGDRISVKIAGSGESDLQDAVKTVAAEDGLDVTWVNFDDWTLPNSALVAGEVDANAFQHTAFLSAYNVANDTDLTPVFSTTITSGASSPRRSTTSPTSARGRGSRSPTTPRTAPARCSSCRPPG